MNIPWLQIFSGVCIPFLGFFFLHVFTKEFRNGLKELRDIQRKNERSNSLFKGRASAL